MNTLHIYIEPTVETLTRTLQLAAEIDAGHEIPPAQSELYLPDEAALARLFTKQRVELWRTLQVSGPISIAALADLLNRDYQDVDGDLDVLIESGLVELESELVSMPWNTLELHLSREDNKRLDEAA
jgi:predicted transcriptional regulator